MQNRKKNHPIINTLWFIESKKKKKLFACLQVDDATFDGVLKIPLVDFALDNAAPEHGESRPVQAATPLAKDAARERLVQRHRARRAVGDGRAIRVDVAPLDRVRQVEEHAAVRVAELAGLGREQAQPHGVLEREAERLPLHTLTHFGPDQVALDSLLDGYGLCVGGVHIGIGFCVYDLRVCQMCFSNQ